MSTVRRIVVGVEASEAGAAALQLAVREAVSRGVPLTAVRAWSPSVYGLDYAAQYVVDDGGQSAERTAAAELAREQLQLALASVDGAEAVDASSVELPGAAAPVLLDAGGEDALIVVGSRGHGALSRLVLGSVSSSVLHHAKGPVLVVPEPRPATEDAPRVLVGVDHSPPSLAALAVAVDEARRRGSVLVPIYAHQPLVGDLSGGFALAPMADTPGLLEAAEQELVTSATAASAGSDVDITPEVVVGHAGAVLHERAHPQDLLVVGSRGHGGFASLLLGSTSSQVAQHAPCPVLVVR